VTELKYQGFEWQSRADIVKALSSSAPERIRGALYSAAQYESDWEWSQAQCLKFLNHQDFEVRWAATLSLGFIALYQRKLDLAKVLPELYAAKRDDRLAPHVEDSLDMIRQYIKTDEHLNIPSSAL
jgi:hypothetical protein